MAVSELQQFIEQSGLSDQEKDMWLRVMELLDDEQADALLEGIKDDPQELESLTQNLKLKQIAFAQGDEELLEQVLQEELETLSRT